MASAKDSGGGSYNQLVERAKWLSEWRGRNPAATYSERRAAVRGHFKCGKSAAEFAIKKLYELDAEADKEWSEHGREKLRIIYERLIAKAEAKDDLTNARKSADSMRTMFSIGGADRVEVTVKDDNDYNAMSDDELAVLAKLDKRKSG